MNERIAKVIDISGLKKIEFAKRLGISAPFVSELCSGVKKPSDRTISDICREFNISETWLRTGKGNPVVRQSKEDELTAAVERLITGESADFKRRLVSALSTLKDEHWILLEQKLKEIVGSRDATAATAPIKEVSITEKAADQIVPPGYSSREELEQEADQFAALAREQFLTEKKREMQVSSAKEYGAG